MSSNLQGELNLSRIEQWLIESISQRLNIPVSEIEVDEPFSNFGLDSSEAVILTGKLASLINKDLDQTLLWDYPNIQELVTYIGSLLNEGIMEDSISDLDSNSSASNSMQNEDIAIIGIGCRFPGAESKDKFWDLLNHGVDAISEIPKERWDLKEFYDSTPKTPGKMNTRWAGLIDKADLFDPDFFGISPREAEQMDPQQRILMETCWEALEDAGISLDKINGTKTGTFIGISTNDYGKKLFENSAGNYDIYPMTGNSFSIAANRISYMFNLTGPSMAIDTACSSSLTSVHMACNSILSKESEMAIAGGVNLILSPEVTVGFSKAGMMSADGRCKTFDHRADGYVRGEGAGVVILKPLKKAIEDGDLIYSVIKGTAINQDGKSNGITAPNRSAQEAVLRLAYEKAKIRPSEVGYVEAHGTGTPLGDPIEVAALQRVFGSERKDGSKLRIGSVKTNMGHLESAAGIAGLIKVALSLSNGLLPKSLHYEKANPNIPFDDYSIYVQKEKEIIPSEHTPFVAGVSSFGFGGTNAHVVLQMHAATKENDHNSFNTQGFYIFPISARSPEQLSRLINHYLERMETYNDIGDLAYSLSTKRSHFKYRIAYVGDSVVSLKKQLADGLKDLQLKLQPEKEIVFVYPNMDKEMIKVSTEIFRINQTFRHALQLCDKTIFNNSGWSLLDYIFREDTSCLYSLDKRRETSLALQLSLTIMWKKLGVIPTTIVASEFEKDIKSFLKEEQTLEEVLTDLNFVLENEEMDVWDKTQELIQEGKKSFMLLGNNQELSEQINGHLKNMNEQGQVLGVFNLSDPIEKQYLEYLGNFYSAGLHINFGELFSSEQKYIRLVSYPWKKQRYWFKEDKVKDEGFRGEERSIAGLNLLSVWETSIEVNKYLWLDDHVINGQIVLPGSVYIELAHSAVGDLLGKSKSYKLNNIQFKEVLYLSTKNIKLQVSLEKQSDYLHRLFIYSKKEGVDKGNGQWFLHTIGDVILEKVKY